MDIAGLSMAMSTQKISTEIGTAVLSKSLDTIEVAGDNMIKILESSVAPNLGQNVDITL